MINNNVALATAAMPARLLRHMLLYRSATKEARCSDWRRLSVSPKTLPLLYRYSRVATLCIHTKTANCVALAHTLYCARFWWIRIHINVWNMKRHASRALLDVTNSLYLLTCLDNDYFLHASMYSFFLTFSSPLDFCFLRACLVSQVTR